MEPFKELLNLKNAELIAKALKKHHSSFDIKKFCDELRPKLPKLELKDRMRLITVVLAKHLPSDSKKMFPLLVKASLELEGFKIMPLTHLVTLYGEKDLELSLKTLYMLTKKFTSEFAIRSFLLKHPKETLNILQGWLKDDCHHVRRLISEGTRPLLPWGEKIPGFVKDPELTWTLLDALKNDDSIYVRKSVANHLNDHSKNNAEWLLKKIKNWDIKKNKKLKWIVQHGLRTLTKAGNLQALKFLGIDTDSIKVLHFKLKTKNLSLGEKLVAEVEIKNLSKSEQLVIIDHEVGLLRKNAKHNKKVFKGKKVLLPASATLKVDLGLTLKVVTTRSYYGGKQLYCLKINGKNSEPATFMLKV